ncbi:MAG TPA: hypothetical protein VGG72_05010 [Bryobacteraceae bacterium]
MGISLEMPTLGVSPKVHGEYQPIEEACQAALEFSGDESRFRIVDPQGIRY